MTRQCAAATGAAPEGWRVMANDDSESDLFAGAREPPPRAMTRLSPLVRRLVAPNASPFSRRETANCKS